MWFSFLRMRVALSTQNNSIDKLSDADDLYVAQVLWGMVLRGLVSEKGNTT